MKRDPKNPIKTTAELRAAMSNYFRTKAKNDGWFKTAEEKQACLDRIFKECRKLKYACTIVPGLICVANKTDARWYTARNHRKGYSSVERALA